MSENFVNGFATATALTWTSGSRAIDVKAQLGVTDAARDYRFTLASSANVSISLSKLTENADLTLYQQSGPDLSVTPITLKTSNNFALTPEIIGTTLAAGTYYLRVNTDRTRIKTSINYDLKLTAAPVLTPDAIAAPPLFAHNPETGQVSAWQMSGPDQMDLINSREVAVMPAPWKLVAVTDWNADGVTDLVWRNPIAGLNSVWLMGGTDGLTVTKKETLPAVPSGWDIVGVADWNKDGTKDIVWRMTEGSQSVVWLMDPTNPLKQKKSLTLPEIPANWQISGVTDWNSDGAVDVVWRDRTLGTNLVWLMGGTENLTITGTKTLPVVPAGWNILGVTDWNQDGTKDLLWRNSQGTQSTVLWFLGGDGNTQIQSNTAFTTLPVGWRPVVADRTSPTVPDAIGNGLENAVKLGNVQPATFSDWIGGNDGNDLYEFDVTERTRLSADLVKVSGGLVGSGIEVRLLDSTGKPIVIPGTPSTTPPQSVVQQLDPGKYYLQILSKGKSLAYDLSLKAFGLESWVNRNIQDVGLQGTILNLAKDGLIDRQDLLEILRSTSDGGGVDRLEFSDLQNLVKGFYELNDDGKTKTYAYLYNLLNKVVNGDAANATYQGNALGNLKVDSSVTQLTALINKWFLGGDRPTTDFVYTAVSGKLFQNGVSYQDINQGELLNSPFLAALASTALGTPDAIQKMFIDNGDGTFTVRFLKPDGTADYVTVDRFLPIDPETGILAYTRQYRVIGNPLGFDDPTNELWVPLAEKAFAQWLESGWLKPSTLPTIQTLTNPVNGPVNGPVNSMDMPNSDVPVILPVDVPIIQLGNRYGDLTRVSFADALRALTGQATTLKPIDPATPPTGLAEAIRTSKPMSFISKAYSTTLNPEIVARQTYTLVGFNEETNLFRLFNPWGLSNQYSDPSDPKATRKPGEISLTIDEIVANFDFMSSAA
jgi:Calpain family cysteine protease/Bacterial pre-peptidase C-terminal domain/FG-GAP-like repeat